MPTAHEQLGYLQSYFCARRGVGLLYVRYERQQSLLFDIVVKGLLGVWPGMLCVSLPGRLQLLNTVHGRFHSGFS